MCPTGGRVAPLAAWAGARRAGVPLILWASLWAHPRSLAHTLSYVPLRRLYRSADAVVTYGPHVSAYVRARGARNVHVAAQSVDNDFWRSRAVATPTDPGWPARAQVSFLFVVRPVAGKGLPVLVSAWRIARITSPTSALVLAGADQHRALDGNAGEASDPPIARLGPLEPERLRDVYAACDVLVVPSIQTRTFREPWGLVVNEAMNLGLALIASDSVGAAAGGLVRDGINGLVVPAGDPMALASAIGSLARDADLRRRLGATGAQDVLAFSYGAWAEGFSRALASVGASAPIGSVE